MEQLNSLNDYFEFLKNNNKQEIAA